MIGDARGSPIALLETRSPRARNPKYPDPLMVGKGLPVLDTGVLCGDLSLMEEDLPGCREARK